MSIKTEDLFLSTIPIAALPSKGHLTDRQAFHHAVMRCFGPLEKPTPRSSAGILFRVEADRSDPRLLIQSNVKPDSRTGLRTIELDPLLSMIDRGFRARLALEINPIRRASRTGKDEVLHSSEWEVWIAQKLGSGFEVDRIIDISDRSTRVKRQRLVVARFDAEVHVTSGVEALRLIRQGVGRRKNYGCGLVSIAPI